VKERDRDREEKEREERDRERRDREKEDRARKKRERKGNTERERESLLHLHNVLLAPLLVKLRARCTPGSFLLHLRSRASAACLYPGQALYQALYREHPRDAVQPLWSKGVFPSPA
jgi:hypothetical protein